MAKVLARRGDHPGLVHVTSAMEACESYRSWHDKASGKSFLKPDSGKCPHYYFYFIDERSEAALKPLYEQLSREAVLAVKAEQVARFLGKKITSLLAQEITTSSSVKNCIAPLTPSGWQRERDYVTDNLLSFVF